MKITADKLTWYGRNFEHNGITYFSFSSSGFCFVLKGKKALATIVSDADSNDEKNKGVIGVYVSEGNDTSWNSLAQEPTYRYVLDKNEQEVVLFESAEEKTVTVRVLKLSEAAFGYAGLKNLEIEGELCVPNHSGSILNMEVIGDSITCGYGIEGVWEKDTFTTTQERADKSYAFLTAKGMNANLMCCSWSGIGLVSKYVDPTVEIPDTTITMQMLWPYTDRSTQLKLGLEPTIWDEKKFSPDIVVIHLGTNDASYVREHEDRRLTYVNALRVFIEAVHRRSPNAKICCCLGVMGQLLCDSVTEAVELFKKDFPKVSIKAVKFPVQLDSDGIAADWHPSAKTHGKVAKQLIEELKNL